MHNLAGGYMDTSWHLVKDVLSSVSKSGHNLFLVQKLRQGYAYFFLGARRKFLIIMHKLTLIMRIINC